MSAVGARIALAGAECGPAPQQATLALVTPSPKRHFAPGQLPFLSRSTYRLAKLFKSERFWVASQFDVEAALRRQVAR